MNFTKSTLLIAISVLVFTSDLFAQSSWLNNRQSNFFTFEFSKPSFNGGNDGVGFFSAAYDLSGGFALGEKADLIVDLPMAYFNDTEGLFDSEFAFGNVYLGIRTGDRSNPVRGEFGVLLPTANDDKGLASLVGVSAMPNREEKMIPDIWGLTANAVVDKDFNSEGAYYRLKGGLFYMKDTEIDLAAIYLDYMAQIGIRKEQGVGAFIGLSGRTGVNDDAKYEEDDASSFIASLGLSYKKNNFEPGLTMNLALDDPFKQLINNVINISLLYHLD